MPNNLLISLQVGAADRAAAATRVIRGLGAAMELHPTLWVVSSSYSAEDAADRVWTTLGDDGRLIVVDSSNDNIAWFNLPDDVAAALSTTWRRNR